MPSWRPPCPVALGDDDPRGQTRTREKRWWPQRDTFELTEFKYAISLHADHRLAHVLSAPDGPSACSWSRCGSWAGVEPATFGLWERACRDTLPTSSEGYQSCPPARHPTLRGFVHLGFRHWLSGHQDEARDTRAPPAASGRSPPENLMPTGDSWRGSSRPDADAPPDLASGESAREPC
jgi:hypothetical protein